MLKTRRSGHDHAIREFAITSHGIEIAATFESAEAILTGIAHSMRPDSGPRPALDVTEGNAAP